MGGDLSRPQLLAAIVSRQGQVQQLLGEIAQLTARLAEEGQGREELTIDLPELARRWPATPKAIRNKIDRPAWSWLRDLGDRHRDGRGRRWLWSEVQAERARRRAS